MAAILDYEVLWREENGFERWTERVRKGGFGSWNGIIKSSGRMSEHGQIRRYLAIPCRVLCSAQVSILLALIHAVSMLS
jgi:hypothetical protein